jgi:hypothetical protein
MTDKIIFPVVTNQPACVSPPPPQHTHNDFYVLFYVYMYNYSKCQRIAFVLGKELISMSEFRFYESCMIQ